MSNTQNDKFVKGPFALLAKFNRIVDRVKRLEKTGNSLGRITSSQTGTGLVGDLSLNRTRPRVAKVRSIQSGGIRRARTTEAATGNNHITCNLYDSQGVEQTSGDESGIEVYFDIASSSATNTSAPRLPNNFDLSVSLHPISPTERRWFCTTILNLTEVCA